MICHYLFHTTKTMQKANKTFTIGSGELYDGSFNCPLLGGTYEVVLVVHDDAEQASNRSIIWKSGPILLGDGRRTPHENWAIPALLMLALAAGLTLYFIRDHRYFIHLQLHTIKM